jgi:hypothetical protein
VDISDQTVRVYNPCRIEPLPDCPNDPQTRVVLIKDMLEKDDPRRTLPENVILDEANLKKLDMDTIGNSPAMVFAVSYTKNFRGSREARRKIARGVKLGVKFRRYFRRGKGREALPGGGGSGMGARTDQRGSHGSVPRFVRSVW